MKILEPGYFEQIRRVNASADQKKLDPTDKNMAEVEEENTRALELLNDRSFEVDLERVEKIKQEINEKQYQIDAANIARGMALSERRGENNMGFFIN